MGDDDELGVAANGVEHLHEPADVRVVERGVHLVEDAEGRRLVLEDREEQADRGHGLFASGEQQDVLKLLARGHGHDVDAGLEDVVVVHQGKARGTAAEELLERLLEVRVDDVERLLEA